MKLLILEQNRQPENQVFTEIGAKLELSVVTLDPVQLRVDLITSQAFIGEERFDLNAFDGVVIRTYRGFATVRFIAHQFTQKQKPVFGLNPFHHSFTQDKVCDLLDLHRAGVRVPRTLLNMAAQQPGLLAKTNWGFGGHGVEHAQPGHQYDVYNHHFQEFIEARSDWRILLVDSNPAPFLIERFADVDDFRTNKHQGGSFVMHDSSHPLFESLSETAKKAGAALHRWCAGVDIRTDQRNTPYVLEVNRTPRLRLEGATSTIVEAYLSSWKKRMTQQ